MERSTATIGRGRLKVDRTLAEYDALAASDPVMHTLFPNMRWEFDILSVKSTGNALYFGEQIHSRVYMSAVEYPDWREAASVAACLAMAVHGTLAVSILPRY